MGLKGEGQLCRVGNGVDGPPQSSAVSDGLGFDASARRAFTRLSSGRTPAAQTSVSQGMVFYRDIALSVRAFQCDRAFSARWSVR